MKKMNRRQAVAWPDLRFFMISMPLLLAPGCGRKASAEEAVAVVDYVYVFAHLIQPGLNEFRLQLLGNLLA